MNEQKIQELLGLLDRELPAFELWLYGHGIIKHHPTDESRIESFADMAFRLRDEVKGNEGFEYWRRASWVVQEWHFSRKKDIKIVLHLANRSYHDPEFTPMFLLDNGLPKHWIVAALIAKELK